MYTALRATSLTLGQYIRQRLEADSYLRGYFNSASTGTMEVTLNTPQEMRDNSAQGLSVWLYRLVREEHRLNDPPERLGPNQLRRPPLPLRLHYLMTPVIDTDDYEVGPEVEQMVLGKVLQVFHDHPVLRDVDLQNDFVGTTVELGVRLEPMSLEEITRVWEALHGSYQLSVSYEVSIVNILSEREPEDVSPVAVVMPEYGVIVSSKLNDTGVRR